MDDMRETFSKLKKGIKHRITGKKQKVDKAQAGGRRERSEVSGSPPQPIPHIVTNSDCEQGENESGVDGEGVELGVTADENKSGWKSTASSSAKLLLRGVRDSADAFGPLKSVAGGLCFILENCEVRPLPICYPQRSLVSQRTEANKQKIESLAPRVKALADRLCEPVAESDVKERERRKRLEQ